MTHLIDKDALVAEIEDKINKLRSNLEICKTENDSKTINLYIGCYNNILSDINTIEVKEVDLEKEYKEYVEEDPVYNKLVNDIVGKAIAKHFFELGMAVGNKAQKGE